MLETNIENLVRTSRHGDKQAYAELIRRFYKPVYLLCAGRIGASHDAEDLAQDIFLKGFTKIRSLREPEKFGSWIGTIARNECRNFLRQKQKSRTQVEFTESIALSAPESRSYEPLNRAIATLPGELRVPLVMYYLDGKKLRQVAEVLGVSAATVQRKLSSAVEILQSRLTREGVEE